MSLPDDAWTLAPGNPPHGANYALVVPIFDEEAVIPIIRCLDALIVIEANARSDRRDRLIKLVRNFGHQIAITTDSITPRDERPGGADRQDTPEIVLEGATFRLSAAPAISA